MIATRDPALSTILGFTSGTKIQPFKVTHMSATPMRDMLPPEALLAHAQGSTTISLAWLSFCLSPLALLTSTHLLGWRALFHAFMLFRACCK